VERIERDKGRSKKETPPKRTTVRKRKPGQTQPEMKVPHSREKIRDRAARAHHKSHIKRELAANERTEMKGRMTPAASKALGRKPRKVKGGQKMVHLPDVQN